VPWWGREEEVIGGCAVAKRLYKNFLFFSFFYIELFVFNYYSPSGINKPRVQQIITGDKSPSW